MLAQPTEYDRKHHYKLWTCLHVCLEAGVGFVQLS